MSDQITWYAIPSARSMNGDIIATVGLDQSSEIACIAYHFDFMDINRNGKVSLMERICSIFSNQQQSINDQIANWLNQNSGDNIFGNFYRNNMNSFMSNNPSSLQEHKVNFPYFQTVVGTEISTTLAAGGVTGISKFIYGTTRNFVINDLVRY